MATKIRLNLPVTEEMKASIIQVESQRITNEYLVKIHHLENERDGEIEKMKKMVAEISVINSDVELRKPKRPRKQKVLEKPYSWADEEIDTLVVLYEQSLTSEEISKRMRIPVDEIKNQIAKLKNESSKLLPKQFKKSNKPNVIGDDVFDLKE